MKAERHQRQLDAFIRHCMSVNGAGPEDAMIISYKDLITALDRNSDDTLYKEATGTVGWFNALAGIDRWKNVRVGFVIGRP